MAVHEDTDGLVMTSRSGASQYALATASHVYRGPGDYKFVPEDVAVCPDTGNVVVTDTYNRRVYVLSSSLQPITMFGQLGCGAGKFKVPVGVALDSRGRVFVSDKNNHYIQVTEQDGRHVKTIGKKGAGRAEFRFPTGIAFDENDIMYVCDQFNIRVQVLTSDGIYIKHFALPQPVSGESVAVPMYIAVKEGRVAVTYKGGDIYMLTSNGEHINTIKRDPKVSGNSPSEAPSAGRFAQARGVAFDTHGNVIVADYVGGHLHVLRVDGQDGGGSVIGQAPGGPRVPGGLGGPLGLAMTTDGNVVVCDSRNETVQVFEVPKPN